MDLKQRIDLILAVVNAAREVGQAYPTHPNTGACITDHYVDRECDCGWDNLQLALQNLDCATCVIGSPSDIKKLFDEINAGQIQKQCSTRS